MKKALLIIDYIHDFVDTSGSLTCGQPAQEIDAAISEAVNAFSNNDDFIVVASDSHTENDGYHPESKLFPAHCLVGTPGCDLYGDTKKSVDQVNSEQLINIKKSRYSAFAGTDLDIKLRERHIQDLYLVGVCSDICVLHTAVDAYNLGYRIFIIEKGIASFNANGHAFALAHFKNTLGATVL